MSNVQTSQTGTLPHAPRKVSNHPHVSYTMLQGCTAAQACKELGPTGCAMIVLLWLSRKEPGIVYFLLEHTTVCMYNTHTCRCIQVMDMNTPPQSSDFFLNDSCVLCVIPDFFAGGSAKRKCTDFSRSGPVARRLSPSEISARPADAKL